MDAVQNSIHFPIASMWVRAHSIVTSNAPARSHIRHHWAASTRGSSSAICIDLTSHFQAQYLTRLHYHTPAALIAAQKIDAIDGQSSQTIQPLFEVESSNNTPIHGERG